MENRDLVRGKRLDNKTWVIGNLFNRNKILVPCDNPMGGNRDEYYIVCKTAGQSAQRKDINNALIFESDIVKYDSPSDEPCIGIVRYGKWEQDGSGGEYSGASCLGFFIERIRVVLREWESEDDIYWRENEHQKTVSILCANNIEVIGNIHDNPELLEL